MTQEEARIAIASAWRKWKKENLNEPPNGSDHISFFCHLQSEKDHLLSFRFSGNDKWQIVKTWLERADRIPA